MCAVSFSNVCIVSRPNTQSLSFQKPKFALSFTSSGMPLGRFVIRFHRWLAIFSRILCYLGRSGSIFEKSPLGNAFGHLMPFFQLSIALAKAGVHVSFISTPKKIQRLPKIPSTLSHSVHFVQLPLPSLDNELLAEGAEATVDIPFEKVQYLKAAYDQMQHSVKQFVANQSPDCIICDFSPHWIIDIALEFQVKLIFFSVLFVHAATFLGLPGTRKAPPEWVSDSGKCFQGK